MKNNQIEEIKAIIRRALDEDVGDGDITSENTIPAKQILTGTFVAKAPGNIAGLDVARETFKVLDRSVVFSSNVAEGAYVRSGQTVAIVRGNGRALLGAERTALNFLQRMSGIATMTRRYVDAVRGTSAIILDTRKTAPGLRLLDRLAVARGGGVNHRLGLSDMVLVKENHIVAAGGITQAVAQVLAADKKKSAVEVEVKNLDELREALSLKVDRILLDNMDLKTMKKAVQITAGRIALEASGSVTLENVARVAKTGVDMISIGALTHSVRALDISFLVHTKRATL
jgi:nicotinate-nucleotide pyrophosphorylase (carboxylating)